MTPRVRNALVTAGKVALGFVGTAIFLASVAVSTAGFILQSVGEQGLRFVRWGIDTVERW